MIDVVPLRYGTAFKKAFGEPLAFSALVKAAIGIDFTPDRVEQEHCYPSSAVRMNMSYDLFAEDTTRRTIIHVQHMRSGPSYDRFLYYHSIGMMEHIDSKNQFVFNRDVYTLIVFPEWPNNPAFQFGRAVCDMDPVTEEGQKLGVYRHRLVFLNTRAPSARLPASLRPLMALIEDTLDGHVDETRYHDEVSQQILSRIRWTHLTPEENARVKEEGTWEAAKSEERDRGRAEEMRTSIADLCDAYGVTLTDAQRAELVSLDLRGLEELRAALKAQRAWPSR